MARAVLCSELALRALLRNLRLLSGMRAKAGAFSVLVAGYEPERVCATIRKLEPAIEAHIVGDESGVHRGAVRQHEGRDHDAAILVQPYHILKGRAWDDGTTTEWAELRQCLHDEDGALGMLWVRTPPRQAGYLAQFEAGLRGGPASDALGRGAGLLPGLAPGVSPMTWVDGLDLPAGGYKHAKHRKFVETVQSSKAEVDAVIRAVHDARFPLGVTGQAPPACPAFDDAVAAARGQGAPTIALDLHGFHAQVTPRKPKVPSAAAAAAAAVGAAAAKAE